MFNFSKQTAIGLDISDYSIEVLQLNKKNEALAYGKTILKEGTVQDGQILNKVALVEQIKNLLKVTFVNWQKVGYGKAILSLPESKVFIHHLTIDATDNKVELEKSILQAAAKIIPFDIQDIYWDYLILANSQQSKKNTKILDILYVGTLKSVVDDYAEVVGLAGLQLVAIDIESISLGRALISDKSLLSATSKMIIDLGARTTIIGIFDSANQLSLSISIPIAGNHFTTEIAHKLKISIAEAENLKKVLGFNDQESDNKVLSILQSSFQIINQEIKHAIDYQETVTGERVAEIILSGGSSLLPKIDQYFSLNFNRPAVIGNPLIKVKNSSSLPPAGQAVFFANVIGLALRGSQNIGQGINLLKNYQPSLAVLPVKNKLINVDLSANKVFKLFKPNQKSLPNNNQQPRPSSLSYTKFQLILGLVCSLLSFIILIFVAYREIYRPLFVYLDSKNNQQVTFYPANKSPRALLDFPVDEKSVIIDDIKTDEQVEPVPEVVLPVVELVIVKQEVMVTKTPTGFLNVRTGPGTNFQLIKKIYPGESYELVEEKNSWTKIKLNEKDFGWVSSKYIIKK